MSNAEMYMLFAKQSKKPVDIKRLTARLDKYFSEYVRRRDADKNGVVRCCTCNTPHHWKDIDAGHFVSRDRKATRWDKKNVHPQCQYCNRFRSGEQHKHGLYIDKRYGAGTAQQLQDISRIRGCKVDNGWILIMIEDMKKEIKKINNK